MSDRVAWLPLACALCMSAASADDPQAARAKEEDLLRAQLARLDVATQALENQMQRVNREHPDDDAGRAALREGIRALDREEEDAENRLRRLVAQDPPEERGPHPAMPPGDSGSVPNALAAPPPPVEALPARGPALRKAADPAAYEKAADKPQGMFHYNAYRWIPVGTQQLVVYTSFDQAFLLDFTEPCPTLLSTERIEVENFSTRVVAGKDGVIADGVRCAIGTIRELHVNRLRD